MCSSPAHWLISRFWKGEEVFNIATMDLPEPLLGVLTFESLEIRVDPTTEKVEYPRSYGLTVL
ncbi:hypothetical protein KEJ48_05125 [Candidatus Bathyarchaeota archaeon]|nr:hypothetical protein [Candidatus Bathyarchaeota archaeon]